MKGKEENGKKGNMGKTRKRLYEGNLSHTTDFQGIFHVSFPIMFILVWTITTRY